MAFYRYSVSVSSKTLVQQFRQECKRRGRQQSWVIENAMRFFVDHPQASGAFGNGDTVKEEKERKPRYKSQRLPSL